MHPEGKKYLLMRMVLIDCVKKHSGPQKKKERTHFKPVCLMAVVQRLEGSGDLF